MKFLYSEFLWGLLAVGIPIAIHLLHLRRPQRVLFTNTGFIREVELITMRRRRLQDLLVLLVRVLEIVFLVLLFAQPFIPAQRTASSDNTVAVLLDTSASMQALGQTKRTLLQEAVGQTQALTKSYGLGAHFRLLGQGEGSLTPASYLQKMPGMQFSGRQVGWADVLGRNQRQQLMQNPLYIFSDFQRGSRGKDALQALASYQQVVLVPQVAQPTANIYVDSLWLDDAFVRTQVNIGLHIRLRNGGGSASTDCLVKVRLGERQVATFTIALAAGQTTTTVVQVQLSNEKLALGQVVTGDSPITFDNTYYFTLQPTTQIGIVEIGNEPVARQAYQAESLFTYTFTKPYEVNYSQLQRANLVLVHEVAVIEAGLEQALVGVVRRGGSVVVVPPGGRTGHEATSRLLRTLGVAGVQWNTATSGVPALQEVAMPNPQNSFFREVFGAQPRQVALPQVSPVLSLGRGGTDILRLRDGDTYLAEYSGTTSGKIYVFTAPFAKEYGDFTTQALFVPVLYRLAMLSYQAIQKPAHRLTTPVVAVELAVDKAGNGQQEAAFRLVHDSLTFIPAQRLRGASLQLELPAAMSQPGFYALQRNGQLITTLAFNANRSESELAAYSAAELRQLVGPNHPNVQVLGGAPGPEALLRYRDEQTGQALWRYCLATVLACLLVEGLLLRFGRPKVAARPAVAA